MHGLINLCQINTNETQAYLNSAYSNKNDKYKDQKLFCFIPNDKSRSDLDTLIKETKLTGKFKLVGPNDVFEESINKLKGAVLAIQEYNSKIDIQTMLEKTFVDGGLMFYIANRVSEVVVSTLNNPEIILDLSEKWKYDLKAILTENNLDPEFVLEEEWIAPEYREKFNNICLVFQLFMHELQNSFEKIDEIEGEIAERAHEVKAEFTKHTKFLHIPLANNKELVINYDDLRQYLLSSIMPAIMTALYFAISILAMMSQTHKIHVNSEPKNNSPVIYAFNKTVTKSCDATYWLIKIRNWFAKQDWTKVEELRCKSPEVNFTLLSNLMFGVNGDEGLITRKDGHYVFKLFNLIRLLEFMPV